MVGRILLAVLGVIVLAFFIPVRIRMEYIETWSVRVWLFGAVPVWSRSSFTETQPTPKKIKSSAKKKAKDKPSAGDEIKALFREEGVSGVMRFFAKLVELLKTTLSSLAKYITVRKLALCVRVGGEEADETATLYGKLSAAAAATLTVLSQLIRVRKPCVRIVPDFASDHIQARLRMIVWVWPFGVVGVGIAAAWRFMMLWIKTMKTPSNGVNNTVKQPVSK